MPLPAWPSGVTTAPLRASYVVKQMHAQPASAEMQLGVARMRSVSAHRVVKIAYVLALNYADYDTFRAWLADDVANGSARFTMDVWNGSDMVNRTCWIDGGNVEAGLIGNGWTVSFTLCVINL